MKKAVKSQGNSDSVKKPMGRPPMFSTPKQLQEKISEYFQNLPLCSKYNNLGVEIQVPVPTITGLALFLGFSDRQSMYDYEKKENFTCVIKKARAFIEKHYEEMLQVGNTTGAIFALKNMGWFDRKQIEQESNVTLNVVDFRKKLVDEIAELEA